MAANQEGIQHEAERLIGLLDADAPVADLAAEIQQTPQLTSDLLRQANAAGNGLAYQIDRVEHAIAVLGRRRVKSLLGKIQRRDPGKSTKLPPPKMGRLQGDEVA